MISFFKKSILCLCVLLFIVLFSYGYSNNLNIKESDIRNNQSKESEYLEEFLKLQLKIAVVVSDKDNSQKLAFIAKNNSKIDIEVSDFRIGENGIEITEPAGKTSFDAVQISPTQPITIKASETKMWFMDIAMILRVQQKEGLYRIKWKIDKVESQEFLLLKEKSKEESLETNTQK